MQSLAPLFLSQRGCYVPRYVATFEGARSVHTSSYRTGRSLVFVFADGRDLLQQQQQQQRSVQCFCVSYKIIRAASSHRSLSTCRLGALDRDQHSCHARFERSETTSTTRRHFRLINQRELGGTGPPHPKINLKRPTSFAAAIVASVLSAVAAKRWKKHRHRQL